MMVRRPAYVLIGGILGLLVLFMGVVFTYGQFSTSIVATEPRIIQVQPGETLRQVAWRLSAEGLLSNPGFLTVLGVLRGDSGNIKAGEYVVNGNVSPAELLDYFVSGRARFVSLTVPEGFSLAEIATRLEARGLGSAERFLALARDSAFIASLDLPIRPTPSTLEGFLFPETYFFHSGVPEASLIASMVNQFRDRVGAILSEQADSVGLTPYEVLILASIVEKETAVGDERPLVSAVFHNRLEARMRLASDPTVIYGINDFDGNLKRVHLLTPTPYNTYKISGLPPTPIANPGLESILATLRPAKVDYLFFVSRGDGTHVFTKDYRSHKRAVWKYQIQPHRKRNS